MRTRACLGTRQIILRLKRRIRKKMIFIRMFFALVVSISCFPINVNAVEDAELIGDYLHVSGETYFETFTLYPDLPIPILE